MENFSDEQKKYYAELPPAVLSEESEKNRTKELERIQTVLAKEKRENATFITSHKPLLDISNSILKPAMWFSTALSVPGLALAGFTLVVGTAFSPSVWNGFVLLLVGFITTMLYWNIVERVRLFATKTALKSWFSLGFSSSEGDDTTYHNAGWYFVMVGWFLLSLGSGLYSGWNIALTSGYQPQGLVDKSQAHFLAFDAQIRQKDSTKNAFVAAKQAEIDKISTDPSYKYKYKTKGINMITAANEAIESESKRASGSISALQAEKDKLYNDAKKNYETGLNDMLSTAQGNGVFAMIVYLLVEIGIFSAIWAKIYYISGCAKEAEKAAEKRTAPPATPLPTIVSPTPQPQDDEDIRALLKQRVLYLQKRLGQAPANTNESNAILEQLAQIASMGIDITTGEPKQPQAQNVQVQQQPQVQTLVASPPPVALDTMKNANDLADKDLIFEIRKVKNSLSSDNANLSRTEKRALQPNAEQATKDLAEYQREACLEKNNYLEYLQIAAEERGLKV